VAEAGIQYYVDWYHDDQPFPMQVRRGSLLSLPYSMDVNDGWNLRLNIDAEEYVLAVRDQFDCLYKEGKDIRRVMNIALHPGVMGQPHRIRHLDRLLEYVRGHDGVWLATGVEIADWFTQQQLPAIEDHISSLKLHLDGARNKRACEGLG
jgi:peptidoglycan/xylan/chitin deacetylase (PgdA/CDA1 family)